MLYPVTDARYAFGYVGGASTLTAAGPLLLAKEHRLAMWLPEAFDDVVENRDGSSVTIGGVAAPVTRAPREGPTDVSP